MKLLPEELTLFPGATGDFQISGGRRPFSAVIDNPGAATLVGIVGDTTVRVTANEVGVETTVRVTVRDAVNATATAGAKIRPNVVSSEVKIEALPSGNGDQTISRCQDGTTLCAGSLARVTAKLSNPAGSISGRPVRFDVIEGQFAYTTDPSFTQTASTVTVLTDATGTASAVLRADTNASTQPATLRVTDEISNARQSVAFTIGGRSLAVIPAKATFTGPRRGVCGSGVADFQVFGGRAPYTVTSVSPFLTVQTPTVPASGGKFRVSAGQLGSCSGTTTGTLTIADSQGAVITATVDIQEGSSSPQSLSVSPSSVTINSCTTYANVVYTGSPSAVASPPELRVTVSSSVISIAPERGAINGTYTVSITDGTSNATVTATLTGLPAAGCP